MRYKSNLLHDLYKTAGRAVCHIFLAWWRLRDKINPPKEEAVLIIGHPDDDTLFFHTFIKKYKPYVCVMSVGWSFRRVPCFIRAMHKYGVRYRIYPLESRDTRLELLRQNVRECLKISSFKLCATHGKAGEYGHEFHRHVHDVVVSMATCKILTPVSSDEIEQYPLQSDIVEEKRRMFQRIYTTETFVLEQYRDWVEHERLIECPEETEENK